MHNYDQDYFVMLEDYEIDDPLTYEIGDYGASNAPNLMDTHLSQPIRFDIFIDTEENEIYSGREPEDIIFIFPYGLILKSEIMEENFTLFNQENTIAHSAYIVSPDEKYFEGYIFIPTPIKPKEWLNKEKSNVIMDKNDHERIRYVSSYSLSNIFLDPIDELKRSFFTWSAQDIGGMTPHLIHKEIVNILKRKKRNIKFIPLIDYDRAMALGGEDFPKSAI